MAESVHKAPHHQRRDLAGNDAQSHHAGREGLREPNAETSAGAESSHGDASGHPRAVYDAERFVATLGHTNQPPAQPGLDVLPQSGPYRREQLVRENPNGSRRLRVEEGTVVDGEPVPGITYEIVVDAKGTLRGTSDPRARVAPERGVKNTAGKVWSAVKNAIGNPEPEYDGPAIGATRG